jgi:hypothetical protein
MTSFLVPSSEDSLARSVSPDRAEVGFVPFRDPASSESLVGRCFSIAFNDIRKTIRLHTASEWDNGTVIRAVGIGRFRWGWVRFSGVLKAHLNEQKIPPQRIGRFWTGIECGTGQRETELRRV